MVQIWYRASLGHARRWRIFVDFLGPWVPTFWGGKFCVFGKFVKYEYGYAMFGLKLLGFLLRVDYVVKIMN